MLDTDLALLLRIDGEVVRRPYLPAGNFVSTVGIYKHANSLLPFKFRELDLVGTFMALVSDAYCLSFAAQRPGHGRCSRRA